MPRARRFNKKIQIWQTEKVSDGFGGFTVSESEVASVWAKLDTLDKFKYSNKDLGTIDFANSVKVTTRDNPNLSINYKVNFIKYRGVKYTLTEVPILTNFEDNFVTFVMVKENNYVAPLTRSFDYQLDFYV
jgi:hypothetical protein